MTIAKVNGHVVPLDYILRNGESVSIVTDPHKKPNPAWLSFVKTARAKEVLRSQINKDQREYLIDK
jgi:GTP pyrophosphokinase